MAFSELEYKRIEKAAEAFLEQRRPPPHIREQVDLGFRISGQSLEIFEIRPRWQAPEEIMEIPIAKATYVKAQKQWKVYWQRANLKWHSYEPHPVVRTVDAFLDLVAQDEYACFFG